VFGAIKKITDDCFVLRSCHGILFFSTLVCLDLKVPFLPRPLPERLQSLEFRDGEAASPRKMRFCGDLKLSLVFWAIRGRLGLFVRFLFHSTEDRQLIFSMVICNPVLGNGFVASIRSITTL